MLESKKHVSTLRNRLEAIVRNNHNQVLVNNSIKNLMKENESLKWIISSKNSEIDKLNELNNQMKAKILQLNKKIDNINLHKIVKTDDFIFQNESKSSLKLLNNLNSLPNNLDFRINSLKPEFANMLNDLSLYGSNAFSNQISGLANVYQRKTAIEFITNHFLGLKEFSERINATIIELLTMIHVESYEDLMRMVSKNMKSIIKAEEILLWLEDSVKKLFLIY